MYANTIAFPFNKELVLTSNMYNIATILKTNLGQFKVLILPMPPFRKKNNNNNNKK